MKHIHAETIIAWAKGATIEYRGFGIDWEVISNPKWLSGFEYRAKPTPKPDVVHGVLITLSAYAGPMLYPASPLEENCLLVFDGTTGKLKDCMFKGA